MRARGQTFTKEFLAQFSQMHYEAIKATGRSDKMSQGPDFLGYPDVGSGHYSDKLTYQEWFNFNVRQRCFKNYLEYLTPAVVFLLIGGLYIPWVSIGAGIVFLFGRLGYTIGYIKKPKLRFPGFISSNFGLNLLLGMSLYSISQMLIEMGRINNL